MSKRIYISSVLAACLCLATVACSAGTGATWSTYQGSMRLYFQAHLPLPLVIYKYQPDGTLAGIFIASRFQKDPGNRHPTPEDLAYTRDKMRQFIITGKVKQPGSRKIADYATALRQFMADEGYPLKGVLDKEKTYTLVLTTSDVEKDTCSRFRKPYLADIKAVRDAIKDAPDTRSYAVRQIKLGGSGFKFGSC